MMMLLISVVLAMMKILPLMNSFLILILLGTQIGQEE